METLLLGKTTRADLQRRSAAERGMDVAQDPYRILGVEPSASDAEIGAAYNRRVDELNPHQYTDPARKQAAAQQLQQVLDAYDEIRRQRRAAAGQRQPFQLSAQVPADRSWAFQEGEPYRTPPPQPGEDVLIVGADLEPIPGQDRPAPPPGPRSAPGQGKSRASGGLLRWILRLARGRRD